MDLSFLMNIPLINTSNFLSLLFRLIIDLVVTFTIIRLIYFRTRKNRTYLFMFGIFNLIIFLVCAMLNHLMLSLGFSFGIFAIFSIMRYRTVSIPIKEMTYLFICISLGIINALTNESVSIVELFFTNGAIIAFTFILEKAWMRNEFMKYIEYEKIENIKPQNYDLLLADLSDRTGLNINRIEVGKINFLRDVAEIRIFFHSDSSGHYVNDSKDNDDD